MTERRPTPAEVVETARRAWGEAELIDRCCEVLTGADGLELGRRLSGFDDDWLTKPANRYWPRVWAARAFRYVWADRAGPAVVVGVTDEHWRVREMCLKVAVRRELSDLAGPAERASGDVTPRVRAAAARVLAEFGEAEAAGALHTLTHDDDRAVRTAAERALARLAERLDREV